MNNQLIENVIKSNNGSCPEFAFENPLLDKNVTSAFCRSIIKILKISKENSSINNNLRLTILENIRKLCQTAPENHQHVDDNFTELLTQFYQENINAKNCEDSNKKLDEFLMRTWKEIEVNSKFGVFINPENLQSLINLNENVLPLDVLLKDVLHWNVTNIKYLNILKHLFNSEDILIEENVNDISIKMKPEIEKCLLLVCYSILSKEIVNIDEIFTSNNSLINLVKKCSVSSDCYQICCGALNFIFIKTNFDCQIQRFVQTFVQYVKLGCKHETFSVLYPIHLSHIIVLLDFDLDVLPTILKDEYIQSTLKHLNKLHSNSDSDLVLLLSHFPQWFDIYFNKKKENETNS